MPRTVLVNGAAGFFGFHAALRLLRRGDRVVGFDDLNDYNDVSIKEARLRLLDEHPGLLTVRADLGDAGAVEATFRANDVRSGPTAAGH